MTYLRIYLGLLCKYLTFCLLCCLLWLLSLSALCSAEVHAADIDVHAVVVRAVLVRVVVVSEFSLDKHLRAFEEELAHELTGFPPCHTVGICGDFLPVLALVSAVGGKAELCAGRAARCLPDLRVSCQSALYNNFIQHLSSFLSGSRCLVHRSGRGVHSAHTSSHSLMPFRCIGRGSCPCVRTAPQELNFPPHRRP